MELAVQDMLPDIQARIPVEQDATQHLARLINMAEGTVAAAPNAGDEFLQTFGHHLSELATGTVATVVQLDEPLGGVIRHAADLADATFRLGHGVLYGAR